MPEKPPVVADTCPEPVPDANYFALLRWHFDRGTRPIGDRNNVWTPQTLAKEVHRSPKIVGHWVAGRHFPDPGSHACLVEALFGTDADGNEWYEAQRSQFETAYRRDSKERAASKELGRIAKRGLHRQSKVDTASAVVGHEAKDSESCASLDESRHASSPAGWTYNAATPVPPTRCFGRREITNALVEHLADIADRRAVALFGTPGTGKTTLARELACHAELKAIFGDRRYFINLESICDAEGLISALADGLALPLPPLSKQPQMGTLVGQLGPEPVLVVLDNLETMFEADREAVEREFSTLGTIANVALVITLRGSDLPLAPRWSFRQEVPPLPDRAAEQLFIDVAPNADRTSPSFRKFLDALGGLPLAIELVAAEADSFLSLDLLWQEWERVGTAVARRRQGNRDRSSSLDHSLDLSIGSNHRDPHCIRLLSLAAFMPKGAHVGLLRHAFGPNFFGGLRDAVGARLALQNGSRIDLLPPIRTYVLARHPLTREDIICCVDYYASKFEEISTGLEAASNSSVQFVMDNYVSCARALPYAAFTLPAIESIQLLKNIARVVYSQSLRKERMPLLDLAHIRLLALVADATQCLILAALDRGDWESAFRLTTLACAANVRNTLVQERNIRRTLSYISREVDSWVDQEKVEKGRRLLEEMNARADELVGIRAVEFGGTSFDSIYAKIDAELDPLVDALRVHQYVFDWSRIESILGSLTEDERRRAVRGKLGIPEAFQNTLDLPFVTLVLTARESAQFSHRIRDELAAREARSIGTGLTLSDMASSSLDVWDQLLGTGRPPEPPG